jgi:hypothetical protein
MRYEDKIHPHLLGFPTQKTAAKEDVRAKPHRCKQKGCEKPAIKSLVWAEGMAYVPTCAEHEQSQRKHLKDQDGEGAFQEVTIKQAAGGQYNILTGDEALKYGAFMGTHLKAIAQISQHADELLDAALEDVRAHDGEGHHFRHAALALGVSGVGPKVCSFAWLLLQPLTSQLATIDTHMMDVLGHHYEKDMSNRDYFKFEREFRAGLDAAGYAHLPLGAGQWGMWDYKRTGPGSHQDHSAMRVLDPKPHSQVDWVAKGVNLKGESWHNQAPDWWQNTQPARDLIAKEWDDTYGKSFPRGQAPYQDLGSQVTSSVVPPAQVVQRAYQMLENCSSEMSLGDTDLVDGWHIETHTIGCRNHADSPEANWWDEHHQIHDEYTQDGISTILGDPASGIFATLTPIRTASVKRSYDEPFSYYWDRETPIGASLDSKARTLAEYATADKLSDSEYEDWLDDHKSDTRLSDEAFKRFKKKTLRKKDRLSKVAGAEPTPGFFHPETGEHHLGMPGQSLMEHARLQTGLKTQEVWRLLADEHVQKV